MAKDASQLEDEIFLSEEEVSKRYGIARSTLANHRNLGTGLRWCKIGGRVLYPASALIEAEQESCRGLSWAAVRKGLAASGLGSEDVSRAEAAIKAAVVGGTK